MEGYSTPLFFMLRDEVSADRHAWSPSGLPTYEGELLHAIAIDSPDAVSAVQDVDFLLGLERDPRVAAALQIRVNGTVNRPYKIAPGVARGQRHPRSQDLAAVEFVRDVLLTGELRPQSGLLDTYSAAALPHALLCGYAVGELIFEPIEGWNVITDIRTRLPSRFVFRRSTGDETRHHHFGYELRMLTLDRPFDGEPLPAGKMVVLSFGSRTNNPRGFGLGARLYWPTVLKRRGLKSWLAFCDKFAGPTLIGKILEDPNLSEADEMLLSRQTATFLEQIHSGSYGILPDNVEVDTLTGMNGSGTEIYETLAHWFNAEIAEIILGNINYGSAQGLSGAPAQSDETVRLEIAKSDADLLHDQAVNRQIIPTLIELNRHKLGDAAYPEIWRDFEGQDDRKEVLERWKLLFDLGYSPSVELVEAEFGAGWERQSPQTPPPTGSPAFAEPDRRAELVEASEVGFERLLDRAVKEGSKKFRALLNPVLGLVNRAKTIVEVRDGLYPLMRVAKLKALQKLLAQSMLAIRLASEYEATLLTEPRAAFADPDLDDPYNLPFSEAIGWFANKIDVTGDRLAELRGQFNNEAFYISGLTNAALLQQMRSLTERILTEGISLDEFKAEFKRLVDESGWIPRGGISTRAALVFENNLRSAFAAGQYVQYTKPHIIEAYPEWEWRHRTPDPARARPHHLAQNGRIFPASADPPFWLPSGHRCRCRMIPRERSGREFAKIEMRDRTHQGVTERAPYDPRTREFLTDPGWGKPPTPQNREELLRRLDDQNPPQLRLL